MAGGSATGKRVRVFVRKARMKLKVFLLEATLRPLRPAGMVRFGTYYGGWWIPEVAPSAGVAVCVGAGTDVTFDLELARLGYRVITVDPTPAAVRFVRETAPQLELIEVGLWRTTGSVEFEQDPVWGESWSIGPDRDRSAAPRTRRLPVKSVKDLLAEVDNPTVAILKIDIEGAEHDVIEAMLADGVRPHCLCVEFDDHRLRQVARSHGRLLEAGYVLWQIEGLNHMYVRSKDEHSSAVSS